jgi:hypothetical protein
VVASGPHSSPSRRPFKERRSPPCPTFTLSPRYVLSFEVSHRTAFPSMSSCSLSISGSWRTIDVVGFKGDATAEPPHMVSLVSGHPHCRLVGLRHPSPSPGAPGPQRRHRRQPESPLKAVVTASLVSSCHCELAQCHPQVFSCSPSELHGHRNAVELAASAPPHARAPCGDCTHATPSARGG